MEPDIRRRPTEWIALFGVCLFRPTCLRNSKTCPGGYGYYGSAQIVDSGQVPIGLSFVDWHRLCMAKRPIEFYNGVNRFLFRMRRSTHIEDGRRHRVVSFQVLFPDLQY